MAEAIVPLPGGRSIPVNLSALSDAKPIDVPRYAVCRYCAREGDARHGCQGCGASSWGPTRGGIVRRRGLFLVGEGGPPMPTPPPIEYRRE